MAGEAPHQSALLALLSDGSCRRSDDLAVAAGITRNQFCDAAGRLIRRDYLERREAGCFRLTEAGMRAHAAGERLCSCPLGPQSERMVYTGSLRERLWRAARQKGVNKKFTVGDLLRLAAHGDERNAKDNAQRYLLTLVGSGYLGRLAVRGDDGKPTRNGVIRYVLVRDTGHLAPVWRRGKDDVIDRNTGEAFPIVRGARP